MSEDKPTKEYFTLKETSEILGVDVRTVQRRIKNDDFPNQIFPDSKTDRRFWIGDIEAIKSGLKPIKREISKPKDDEGDKGSPPRDEETAGYEKEEARQNARAKAIEAKNKADEVEKLRELPERLEQWEEQLKQKHASIQAEDERVTLKLEALKSLEQELGERNRASKQRQSETDKYCSEKRAEIDAYETTKRAEIEADLDAYWERETGKYNEFIAGKIEEFAQLRIEVLSEINRLCREINAQQQSFSSMINEYRWLCDDVFDERHAVININADYQDWLKYFQAYGDVKFREGFFKTGHFSMFQRGVLNRLYTVLNRLEGKFNEVIIPSLKDIQPILLDDFPALLEVDNLILSSDDKPDGVTNEEPRELEETEEMEEESESEDGRIDEI